MSEEIKLTLEPENQAAAVFPDGSTEAAQAAAQKARDDAAVVLNESVLSEEEQKMVEEFAKQIVILCRDIKAEKRESILTNQLLRSGTSIGANVHEAQYAQGTKDFISKFEIALKECSESEFWIELIYETNGITPDEFDKFQKYCVDLRRMLVSSVTTLKNKHKSEKVSNRYD